MTNSHPSGHSTIPSARSRGIRLTAGISLAVVATAVLAACGSSGNSTSAAPSTTAPSATSTPQDGHRGNAVMGKVTAENGNSWTIQTRSGTSDTVTITPQTTFGTKKDPQTQSQFAVGDSVRIQ